MRRYILPLIAALGAHMACGQDLRTEITVDRTVQPDIREATRPNGLNANLINPEFSIKKPTLAEYTMPGQLTGDLSLLPITPWSDSIQHTPYRGYVNIGYFPTFNGEVSAGYHFLNNERANAGIWLQYNGISYNGDFDRFDGALFNTNFATLGANTSIRTGSNSTFTADIEATYGIVRNPYYNLLHTNDDLFIEQRRSYNQSSMVGHVNLGWTMRHDRVVFGIRAGAEYTSFGKDVPSTISSGDDPITQIGGKAGISLGICSDESITPWIGIDMDWEALNSNTLPYYSEYSQSFRWHKATMVQGRFTPYVRFGNDYLMGRAGFNVDIAQGNELSQIKLSPAVSLEFQPADILSIHCEAQGGQYLNRMSDLYQLNPYMITYLAYERSYTPLLVNGGIDISPLRGLTLSALVGCAIAKDYLLPQITTLSVGLMRSSFSLQNINSLCYGARIAYNLSRWFNISAAALMGSSDSDYNSWYEWRDGAKRVIDASLTIHPVVNLDISASYQLRTGRRVRTVTYPYNTLYGDPTAGILDTGDVSNLNVGVNYRITPALTVYAQVDNVLGCKYQLISGMPGKPLNGLVGVGYKF